jgi:hypothetical protein
MSASSAARDLAASLSDLAGNVSALYTTLTSGGSYGGAASSATDQKDVVIAAIGTFRSAAEILAAVTVTWKGVEQSAVELALKLNEMLANIGVGIGDTDAADAATAFNAAADLYEAGGH